VLTDAVEEAAPRASFARAPVTPRPVPAAPAPVAKTIVTPPPAARAPSAPAPRPATPPPARPAAAATPPPPPRRLLEPKAAAPSAPPPAPAAQVEEDPDVLRQTQTMRAISLARSIDDVSDSMAETLFGEAELDFLSATLASAVGEGEEPQAAASASAPTPPATSSPTDDLMDLFNLGPDAPLELIDDSATATGDQRKTAARRGG
jgi:hypothetical protein